HFNYCFRGEKEKISTRSLVQILFLVILVAIPLFGALILPISVFDFLPSETGTYGGFKGTDKGVIGIISFEGDFLLILCIMIFFSLFSLIIQLLNDKLTKKEALTNTLSFIAFDIPLLLALGGSVLTKESLSISMLAEDIRRIIDANMPFGFVILLPLSIFVAIGSLSLKFHQTYYDRINSHEEIGRNPPTPKNYKFHFWNVAQRIYEFFLIGVFVSICLGGVYLPIPNYIGFSTLSYTFNFIFKEVLILLVCNFVRSILPRLRINQILNISLKLFMPLGILSMILIGGYIGIFGLK
ncbi:MAG: NADH-quinone oxidoreductase subunit H, partial [Asgard group archaeon]|nr:NADH-quinone oxidoreductase subunit H [Asgard group archaeon]